MSLNARRAAAVVFDVLVRVVRTGPGIGIGVPARPDANVGRTGIGGVNPRSLVIFVPALDIHVLDAG